MLLPEGINRCIDILHCAAGGVLDDQRPGLVGLAQGDGVGMARPSVAAQRFVGNFGHMGSAHHHRNAGGAYASATR